MKNDRIQRQDNQREMQNDHKETQTVKKETENCHIGRNKKTWFKKDHKEIAKPYLEGTKNHVFLS